MSIVVCLVLAGCDRANIATPEATTQAKQDAPTQVIEKPFSRQTAIAVDSTPNLEANISTEPASKDSENPAEDLVAIHIEELLAWQNDYRAAAKEDRADVLKLRPSFAEYYETFAKMADDHQNTPIAASALGWMAIYAPKVEDKARALQTLIDRHVDSTELASILDRVVLFEA